MSTRRARIKPVVTLFPPRRKNNDVADNTKAKILEKETIEKPSRPPDNFDRRSPQPGFSLLKSLRPENKDSKNQAERLPSPLAQTEVIKEVSVTPKSPEDVSVNTSIYSVTPNVFVSPRNVGSSLGRHVVAPLVHSSKVEVNVQICTPVTPEKIPEKPKQKSVERRPMEVDVTDGKSKEAGKDVVRTVSSNVPGDYNVPSVPESTTEDIIMDGIVPLQAVSSAPKPLAMLKNEIISENAEVLFDPIVPLLSPSKMRPKLRPVPRLAPLRRTSLQGSVSEAEDESRRALLSGGRANTLAPPRQSHDLHTPDSTMHSLPNREVNRIRNEPVCSSVSQATVQPPAASSPAKDKPLPKCRRLDVPRRMPAMRRRRETGKKDKLTMYDLIFTNPTSNPIVPDKDDLKAQQANEKQEAARKAALEHVEDKVKDQPETDTDAAPVPQIKLGPNGEIMLDEQSLVIKQSVKRKVSTSIVHEGASGTGSTSGRYRRTQRTAKWSDAETVRFYRALATLGTDFMIIENLFPGRTRRDLKLKFKREERVNMALVEKALRTTCKWDLAGLENEFRAEREEEARAAQQSQQRAIEQRRRQKEARELRVGMSRGAKALGASTLASSNTALTADDLILQHHEAKTQESTASSQFATITRVTPESNLNDMATIRKIDTKTQGKPAGEQPSTTPVLPSNVEDGSLVVVTVIDPGSPSNKVFRTYMASDGGRLTAVTLPTLFLNNVITYMKTGVIPQSNTSAGSTPQLTSSSSATNQDSRPCPIPRVI